MADPCEEVILEECKQLLCQLIFCLSFFPNQGKQMVWKYTDCLSLEHLIFILQEIGLKL